MANVVVMPKLGITMQEGTVGKWLVKEGDSVQKGDPILTVQTDKTQIEVEAPESGILLKIVKNEGEIVPVSEMVGIIVSDENEDISSLLHSEPTIASNTKKPKTEVLDTDKNVNNKIHQKGKVLASPKAKALAAESGIDLTEIEGTGRDGLITEKDVTRALSKATQNVVRVSPVAKKIAEQNNIDLLTIDGTGARGKIMKSDLITASIPNDEMVETVIPFNGIRKVISDNMMKSLHGTAQANHRIKVDVTKLIQFRESLKTDGVKVSFTDILIKMVAKALLEFPILNSTLRGDEIVTRNYVNMGIAVALEEGLIVPVIKNAHKLDLKELSDTTGELIEKARNGRLTPEDYTGGTFTITNLGMYDIDEFTAIINPPEVGILAVGKIDKVPIVENDSIVVKPIMVLSLTYDHRIVDGAPAAQFLRRLKQIIQNPFLLV